MSRCPKCNAELNVRKFKPFPKSDPKYVLECVQCPMVAGEFNRKQDAEKAAGKA